MKTISSKDLRDFTVLATNYYLSLPSRVRLMGEKVDLNPEQYRALATMQAALTVLTSAGLDTSSIKVELDNIGYQSVHED